MLDAIGPEQGGGRGGRWAVLLVEDDAGTSETYRTGLEAFGFRVRVEVDGAGLFRAVESELPDIVVLDWELPDMSGDEVLHRVRLDERTRSLPVLILSDFPASSNGEVDRVFLLGALAWLQKVKTPPAQLAEKLTEALTAGRD